MSHNKIRDLIIEAQKDPAGLSKFSRMMGLDFHALRQRISTTAAPEVFKVAYGPEPEDIRSLGRPGSQQYVIAIKRAGSNWPAKFDDVLANARQKFDDGTHEMFQTTDDGWVVQYLIPRLIPVRRRYFFSSMDQV